MDDEVRKVFDRIEQDILSRSPPEEATAGYLMPRETPDGVRYVRSRKPRLTFPRSLGSLSIGVLIILAAAAVAGMALLTNDGGQVADWQLALGFMYPLQLALDLVGVARLTWPMVKWRLGDLELELSASGLRGGIRCGPLWLDAQSIPVGHVQRLVVVKRPEGKGDTIWSLVVERDDGLSLTFLSADDPGNVVPLAKDLHARLARRQELGARRWPALTEEDRPAEVLPDRPPRRPLLPGGGWTWLAIHVIGSAGLFQVVSLPWFKLPGQTWRGFVRLALGALQALVLIVNISLLRMSRATTIK